MIQKCNLLLLCLEQGLLADKSAEVVGDTSSNGLHSWLAVSPASDTDESDSAGMPAPAQAPSQEAAPAAAPAQVPPIPILRSLC